MTNETKNKFAEILAKAQSDASKKTVLKSTVTPEVKKIVNEVVTEIKKDINERPEISTTTFEDVIKEVTPIEVLATAIQLVDYSDKAFAIIGDTKPVKDKLKSLGGRFNPFLKCGPGWIFPKRQQSTIKLAFNL